MKFNLTSALLALSLTWTQLPLNAKNAVKRSVASQDPVLEQIERICAVLGALPSLEELFVTQVAPTASQQERLNAISSIGSTASFFYSIISTGLENDKVIMDCKQLIDSINAAKRGKELFTREVSQDVLVSLTLASLSLAAQKISAKKTGDVLSGDNQRVVRRAVRAVACGLAKALFDVTQDAYNNGRKDMSQTFADYLAASMSNLVQNGCNEFVGEMIVNMANEKSTLDIVKASCDQVCNGLSAVKIPTRNLWSDAVTLEHEVAELLDESI